jgi:hypothetical protein
MNGLNETQRQNEGRSPDLLFGWSHSRGTFPWLPLFLVVSALAHAGTFFIFRVVYPEHATLPAPSPKVAVLSADNPAHAPLLRWIEAEDPAQTATAFPLDPPQLQRTAYAPSYGQIRTPARQLGERAAPFDEISIRPPLALIRSGNPQPAIDSRGKTSAPTRLHFSAELARLPLKESPRFIPVSCEAAVEPARFLVGVSARGEVRHVFAQKSCGDPRMDLQAMAHLKSLSFGAQDTELLWGEATFYWGDDLYVDSPPGNVPKARP